MTATMSMYRREVEYWAYLIPPYGDDIQRRRGERARKRIETGRPDDQSTRCRYETLSAALLSGVTWLSGLKVEWSRAAINEFTLIRLRICFLEQIVTAPEMPKELDVLGPSFPCLPLFPRRLPLDASPAI